MRPVRLEITEPGNQSCYYHYRKEEIRSYKKVAYQRLNYYDRYSYDLGYRLDFSENICRNYNSVGI